MVVPARPLRRAEAASRWAELLRQIFEVDPLWPKPLPNHWILGQVIGVDVDAEDNVWIIHRNTGLDPKEVYPTLNPPASECCIPAPPVLPSPASCSMSHTASIPLEPPAASRAS